MQRVRLRRTALRATPRMHTSTQPPEGAGGSRSTAAGELTLGLLSGEKQQLYADSTCRSEPARDGGLKADQSLSDVRRSKCGSEPAREDGLTTAKFLSATPNCSFPRSRVGMPPGTLRVPFCVERCVKNTELSHAFFRLPGRKQCP
jgi:hypothetical protein